jgi:excinuclease ABC subunit A
VDQLVIRGAREHNLRNISIDLPRDRLIVFTGLSGSGKSSLAFDTIYAEGQRRYIESFSAYSRQFLQRIDKKFLYIGNKKLFWKVDLKKLYEVFIPPAFL